MCLPAKCSLEIKLKINFEKFCAHVEVKNKVGIEMEVEVAQSHVAQHVKCGMNGERVRNHQVEASVANKLAQIKRHKPQVVQQTQKYNFKSNSICVLHLLKFFFIFTSLGIGSTQLTQIA